MATISEKVKTALAAIEAATKALSVVDEDHASAEQVRGLLDIRRSELAQTEQQLQQIQEAAVQAGNEHAAWQELHARERMKANTEIDALQATLQALDVKVKEAQARHDNIVAGISALHARLRV
jgi:hypothetical protein